MIHYIQPYRSDRQIGKAINEAIMNLAASENDWICLTDHDCMWLHPDSKAQLEHIVANSGYDVLGPVTNRLAQNYQLLKGAFDQPDIREHVIIANRLHAENWGKVQPYVNVLAAFCLCFRISTWDLVGHFSENSLQFDSQFSVRAKRKGLKLGLMTGIYVFHLYRMWSDNPKQDIRHLVGE